MNKFGHSKTSFSLKSIVTILTVLSISTLNNFYGENAFAQNSTNTTNTTGTIIDSFRTQGQISILASDTLAGRENSTENVIWVLGGNWEFNIADGNLTNFVVDIDMAQVDGTNAHKHTIESLSNATGMPMGLNMVNASDLMAQHPITKISLQNNYTMFNGIADITTNENIQWNDVLTHVTLLNGNVFNLSIDPLKTDDHFYGLPVFGTVQSIVDEYGKELVKR
ncbi:MAG: hypothetical protein L0H53_16385 [Candidatus Nitrosocosmicus sp.]|nr:hypothetical protein [Candidatus Nitrosocosmicus sp.]